MTASAYTLLSPAQWAGYDGPQTSYPGGKGFSQTVVNGVQYDVIGPKKPWSISAPDPVTVRLELRQGDQAPFDVSARSGSERNELGAIYNGGRIPIRTPIHVKYGLHIEKGPKNSASWFVLTQLHEDEVSGSPPISICLAAGSDVMTINKAWTNKAGKSVNGPIWTDTAPLGRNRRYVMEQWMTVDPDGAGRLKVARDGAVLVDHTGPVGYRGQTNSFWKFGPYRHGPTPETIAVRYDHMQITVG